jgi:phosphatidylethanolamine/phosphatidyl-N-methylethanolamine N-methyltransferase
MWNRLRYTLWAPFYDAIVSAVGFGPTRRRSIEYLRLHPGHRVLIVGAGTGLDLAFLPPGTDLDLTAVDVTPAMLTRLERRAAQTGRGVTVRTMDARELAFADESFDAVIMHLILAVMPQPERGLREAARVLRGGGRISVFDKFVRDDERVSPRRRLVNIVAKPLFSDMNRRFGPLLQGTGLTLERDEPAAFGGMYRIITLQKPLNDSDATRDKT